LLVLGVEPASIDEAEFPPVPFGVGVYPVPRDPGDVLDYGLSLANEAVEECGFSDVRSSDYCDERKVLALGRGFILFHVGFRVPLVRRGRAACFPFLLFMDSGYLTGLILPVF